jgi:hypothetical protein
MAEHALCTLCSLETNSMIPDGMDIITISRSRSVVIPSSGEWLTDGLEMHETGGFLDDMRPGIT